MRTILLLIIFCLFFSPVASAKNYIDIHAKEMKNAEKYSSVDEYFEEYSNKKNINNKIELKNPIQLKLDGYDEKILFKYEDKIKKDNIEIEKVKKYIYSKNIYKTYQDDFYFTYRIAEKIIRANNIDFVNWRIFVDRTKKFNASSSELNCITLHSGLIDTFKGNDDAMAFVIAHEIAHSVLGHQERLSKMKNNQYYLEELYYKHARNAELAADIEAAKLIIRAGYDLNKAKEVLSIINTLDFYTIDFRYTHPTGEKRVANFEENTRYLLTEELIKQGKYNIINSQVLKCDKSTNRKSFVILRNELKDRKDYYKPETIEDVYRRVAHMSYKNKEMKKSSKYFKKLSKLNKNDIIPHLYLSYIAEYNYKLTNKEKFLEKAKKHINTAYSIDKNNEHVLKQMKDLGL